jgi:hypothetical protein
MSVHRIRTILRKRAGAAQAEQKGNPTILHFRASYFMRRVP